MGTVLLIAGKDLRQRLRDRSLLMMALALPFALSFIFNLVFGGVDDGEIARYAVADEDHGAAATHFVDDVLRPIERQGVIALRTVPSAAEGRRLADRGDVAAVFVIPAGFTAAAQAGRPATLRVVGNVDSPVRVQVARSIAESYTAQLNSVQLSVVVAARGAPANPEQAAALARQAAAVPAPVAVADSSATRRELDTKTYYAAGMAVFFLFFTVQFGVNSLLDERRDGTMARLLAAPIPRSAILWGKLTASFVVGVVSMFVLIAATQLLLGARWGNLAGVALLVVAGVLAATGVMALVATLAKTAEQSGNWQAIIAIVLGMLGGVFFPISQATGVGWLSYATPHRWFMQGLADLSGGGGIGIVLPAAGAMAAFAAVTGGIALLRIGRMVRP
ncbi:MAG TPA: ABC transporter permease [Streptosporangiaceae bacterium]|jgi:ABC-2 type transport system permease protein